MRRSSTILCIEGSSENGLLWEGNTADQAALELDKQNDSTMKLT